MGTFPLVKAASVRFPLAHSMDDSACHHAFAGVPVAGLIDRDAEKAFGLAGTLLSLHVSQDVFRRLHGFAVRSTLGKRARVDKCRAPIGTHFLEGHAALPVPRVRLLRSVYDHEADHKVEGLERSLPVG